MLTVFQVCFFVGIGLTVLSFVFAQLFDFIGMDGLDFDVFSVDLFLPLSPLLVILFTAVFGGTGWIFMELDYLLPMPLIIIAAVFAGGFVAFLLHKCVISPLKKAQNTSAPNEEDLIGLQATVTESIYPKGYGEITYVINGNTYVAPAKSTTQEKISRGSNVAICWIKDYVFYVSNISL